MQKRLLILLIILVIVCTIGFLDYIFYLKVSEPIAQNQNIYRNYEYGFELNMPLLWKGFSLEKQNWQGWVIDTGEQKYSGTELVIKNPHTTSQQKWQDIPIMVFSHEVWNLVDQEKVSVSAAPIGPAKIGENSKYVFATPPRWYGFTDAIGWQEAVEIVKTFKAF